MSSMRPPSCSTICSAPAGRSRYRPCGRPRRLLGGTLEYAWDAPNAEAITTLMRSGHTGRRSGSARRDRRRSRAGAGRVGSAPRPRKAHGTPRGATSSGPYRGPRGARWLARSRASPGARLPVAQDGRVAAARRLARAARLSGRGSTQRPSLSLCRPRASGAGEALAIRAASICMGSGPAVHRRFPLVAGRRPPCQTYTR